jgi:hypothetical protein
MSNTGIIADTNAGAVIMTAGEFIEELGNSAHPSRKCGTGFLFPFDKE